MKPVPEIKNCSISGFSHHHYADGHVSVDVVEGVALDYSSPEEAAIELPKLTDAYKAALYRERCMECN